MRRAEAAARAAAPPARGGGIEGNDMQQHLAQINIGRLRHPQGEPARGGFL